MNKIEDPPDGELCLRLGYLYRILASAPDAQVLAIGDRQLLRGMPQFQNLICRSSEMMVNPQPLLEATLAAGSFDLVIIHGVLASLDEHTQQRLLERSRELLKENGVLAVATTNSLYYRRLAGKLKSWLVGKKTNDKSFWGYGHLLKSAGFRNFRAFTVLPNYQDPVFVVSTERISASVYYRHELEKYISHGGLARNLLRYLLTQLNLYRYVEHSFLLSVEKL